MDSSAEPIAGLIWVDEGSLGKGRTLAGRKGGQTQRQAQSFKAPPHRPRTRKPHEAPMAEFVSEKGADVGGTAA